MVREWERMTSLPGTGYVLRRDTYMRLVCKRLIFFYCGGSTVQAKH